MSLAGRFVSGLLLGAALAGVVLFWPNSEPQVSAQPTTETTTTTSAPEIEPFLEAGEVVFGATALLPRGLEIEDGVARFSYELAGLGPTLGTTDFFLPAGDVLTFPETWVLTTETGATVGGTTGPLASTARFELPSANAVVAQIEVIGWRRATPFGERLELPIEVGSSATFRSGEAIIVTVLEQRTSTIVQIDFDSNGGDWHNGILRSAEPGWRFSPRQSQGIDTQLLNVYRNGTSGGYGVSMEQGLRFFYHAGYFLNWLDGAYFAIGVHNGHQYGIFPQVTPYLFRVNHPMFVHRDFTHLEAQLFQRSCRV